LWAGATEAGIACEDAGETAFRRDLGGGGMGDRTYYFGGHATQMHGPKDIDLAVDPPPDLAVEVEVTHSPTEALAVYQRLGVPEIWHVIAREDLWTVRIWRRQAAGSYELVERSSFLPLSADDLLEPAPPGPLERRRPLGRASADLGPRGLVDSAAALRNGRR
ncbi:MAG: Uma2 family endonuclease, partial [Isosphaeraceae bacterium]|nr:Uma2 family endonuclease [Isosphaeraceae bacterium]